MGPAHGIDFDRLVSRTRARFVDEGRASIAHGRFHEVAVSARSVTFQPHEASENTLHAPVAGQPWTIETTEINVGHDSLFDEDAVATVDVDTIRIDHGAVQELLINMETGLEQQWLFETAPVAPGDLAIVVQAFGLTYGGWSEDGHHFIDEETGLGVRYGNATWIDGTGVETALEVEFVDGALHVSAPAELLATSAYPAVLDPTIYSETLYDHPQYGPASYDQKAPAVASDGNAFLVVWEDQRNGGNYDIYGARIDPAHQLLDPVGFAIAEGGSTQRNPTVTFSGTDYVVAWEDDRAGDSAIFASRVTTGGGVLDPSGVMISSGTGDRRLPTVAAAATGLVFAWEDLRGTVSQIYAARVSSALAVVDTAGVLLSAAALPQTLPSIACIGDNCLVAFSENVPGTEDLFAVTFDAFAGGIPAGRTLVSDQPGRDIQATLAAGPGDFMLAWDRKSGSHDVYAQRVSIDGNLAGEAIAVATAANHEQHPAIAFDGTRYLAVWKEYLGGTLDVRGARISSAGIVEDEGGFDISMLPNHQNLPVVAAASGRFFASWQDQQGRGKDIYGTEVSSAGVVSDSSGFLVARAGSRRIAPAIAYDGGMYFAVFTDSRASGDEDYDLVGIRVRRNGTLIDTNGIVVSNSAGNQTSPHLSYNPDLDEFLVVWADDRSGDQNLWAKRVNANGYTLGPEFVLSSAVGRQRRAEASYNTRSDRWMIVWEDSRNGNSDIYAATINGGTNTVNEPNGTPVSILAGNQAHPTIAANGLFWVIAYCDESQDDGDILIAGGWFDGTIFSADFVLAVQANRQAFPKAFYDGQNIAIGWEDSRDDPAMYDVYGATVTNGGFVQVGGVQLVADAGAQELRLSAASIPQLGGNDPIWFFAWREYNTSGQSDLRGALFDRAENPIGTPFVISGELGSEDQPYVLGSSGGNALVSYQRFDGDISFRSERIFVRRVLTP